MNTKAGEYLHVMSELKFENAEMVAYLFVYGFKQEPI